LRDRANDRRWRVREGVARDLQRVGDADIRRLVAIVESWSSGSPLERRAAVAAICEPRLLDDRVVAGAAVSLLDRITTSLGPERTRASDEVRALRKALGYGWSVAIVADPAAGKPAFERHARSADPDVRWIIRDNLREARLRRLDPDWVERLQAAIASQPAP
jgi:hypothetical protein